MEILKLTILISGVLAFIGVVLFAWSVKARSFDHADRLALLPLQEDKYVDPNVHRELADEDDDPRADAKTDETVTSPG